MSATKAQRPGLPVRYRLRIASRALLGLGLALTPGRPMAQALAAAGGGA